MQALTLGYSPCPNDTFIFYGLVHGVVPGAPVFDEILQDIESLNLMAAEQCLDVTKISFHALAHLREEYCLLHSGGALGRGCGPLVVANPAVTSRDLATITIAIPGELTTAALLLRLHTPKDLNTVVMPFHEILPATASGTVDAGVIIHESRFTYSEFKLRKVVDLGEWWETTTGHPIPLGGILARRNLGGQLIASVDKALRLSVQYAYDHPDIVRQYIRAHAQEMDDTVLQQHIDLYVNQHTLDYGPDGEAAIKDLLLRAESEGIIPHSDLPIFADG
jgi:1,4-dihydroxy-6-naphthoate synthase